MGKDDVAWSRRIDKGRQAVAVPTKWFSRTGASLIKPSLKSRSGFESRSGHSSIASFPTRRINASPTRTTHNKNTENNKRFSAAHPSGSAVARIFTLVQGVSLVTLQACVAPHDDWCAQPPPSALISRAEMLDSIVFADPDALTIA